MGSDFLRACVVIPFRGDAGILRWTLDGFAAQRLPHNLSLEIRVGGDDCTPPPYSASSERIRFTLQSFPRSGVAGVKNLLLKNPQSDILIFANADTRPVPDFVAKHVARLRSLPAGHMVLGSSPFEPSPAKTVFDALKEETPMVFFYDELKPGQSYDYRHAWNLNVSVRTTDFTRLGGFATGLRPYGYEDLDFAFRLMASKPNVFFEPTAAVTHRHPLTLDQYLDREEALGSVAPVLSRVNPDVYRALFGDRDIAADYRVWTSLDLPSHRWIYHRLSDWADQPESALGPADSSQRRRLLLSLYQMHIPLKRLAFRLGFLRGLELTDDSRWLERGSRGLWKQAIS